MKKIISQILVIALIAGMMIFPVNASDDAITYLTENLWKTGSISESTTITRAQAASVLAKFISNLAPDYDGTYTDVTSSHTYAKEITLATNLGLVSGSGGKFRPDASVTKEEFTIMLVRAYEILGHNFSDKEYASELMKDYESVSSWAKDYVAKGLADGVVKGEMGKLFSPAATVKGKDLADAVYNMHFLFKDEKVAYSVRDITSSDRITSDFNVLQSGGAYQQASLFGYGMLAKFSGAPGEIYVARTTAATNKSTNLHGDPKVICKIIGPDGFTVCRVNLYYKNDGTMEKIVNIPSGPAGIYRIQFVGGRNGDVMTIGVKSPTSWGVYGEPEFTFTDTTPKTSYFWVPQKYDTLCLGIAQSGATASVYTKTGTTPLYTTPESTGYNWDENVGRVNMKDLTRGSVYRLEVASNFRGRFALLGGSALLCPTAAMAEDLKGGFVNYSDEYISLQTFGPLQAKARARMTEIYKEMGSQEAFAVDTNLAPSTRPQSLDNIVAEAILGSAFSSSLIGIKTACDAQVLDPTSPFMGMYMGKYKRGESAWPTLWWEHSTVNPADGESERAWLGPSHLTGALTINAETNYWYNNEAIRKRVELQYLAWALTMNLGNGAYYRKPDSSALVNYWTQTQFYLGEHGMPSGYFQARNFLSPETRKITDQAISEIIEQMMYGRGQGNTNQILCSIEAALYGALAFPEYDHYLDFFNSSVEGVAHPSNLGSYTGQAPLGYLIEDGADGSSYQRMNEGIWDTLVFSYLHELPEERQDAYTKGKLIEATERLLIYDSLFYAPSVGSFKDVKSSAFTGRTEGGLGNGSTVLGNFYLIRDFPRAKANWIAGTAETKDPATTRLTDASQNSVINAATAAYYMDYYWSRWGKMYSTGSPDSYMAGTTRLPYISRHIDQEYAESEVPVLPYAKQQDYYVYEVGDGAVGIKHKGMYYQIFYSNGLDTISGYSWHTAAPMEIWDEYFSTVMASQKPHSNAYQNLASGNVAYDNAGRDYRTRLTLDKVVTSGVVGTLANGDIMIEGKEYHNKLTWIEAGKKFRISGQNCYGGKKVVWTYTMTDEGMEIEGGVESVASGDDLWIQIPLIDRSSQVSGATLTYSSANNKVVAAHNGKSVTFSWDAGTTSQFLSKRGTSDIYRELQLKLTPSKPTVKIKITRNVGSYTLTTYSSAGV